MDARVASASSPAVDDKFLPTSYESHDTIHSSRRSKSLQTYFWQHTEADRSQINMVSDMFWGGAPPLRDAEHENELHSVQDATSYDKDLDSSGQPIEKTPQPEVQSGTTKTGFRVPGGIAPTFKRIRADYDSDDARIIELKQQMHTDEQVATILEQEGRVRYQAKTVGSRWQRLRKMLMEREEQRLDDELTDWHDFEDEPLNLIVAHVDTKYQKQHENLDEKKWHEVSLHLAEKLQKRKYTGKACRERFEGLRDGTALLPIEQDDDQQGRRKLREDRIAAAKTARLEAENAIRDAEGAKKARLLARKKEREDAENARLAQIEQRKAEKAERKRIKEERKFNKEQAIQHRADWLEQLRIERDWMDQKRRIENQLCKQYSGNTLKLKLVRFGTQKSLENSESDEGEESEISDFADDEESSHLMVTKEAKNRDCGSEYTVPYTLRRRLPRANSHTSDVAPRKTRSRFTLPNATLANKQTVQSMKEETTSYVKIFNKAPVTRESLLNPRSIMSDAELDALLALRELPDRNEETHPEIVARLAASDHELKGPQLDALLGHHDLKSKSKKAEKILLLQKADAATSENGQMGMTSTDMDFMQRYEGYTGRFAGLVAEAAREKSGDHESWNV